MYHGQFLLDKYLHETFFINKTNGYFVECGALDGLLEVTCKFFEDDLQWTGINIEAVPPLFDMLIKNRPNCINMNYGLSNKDGIATFTHAIHPNIGMRFGNGSLTHHISHKKDLENQGCTFKEYEIECKKFSSIFNYKHEIDLFVLDVEGHELQAIEGIIEIEDKFLPKVFCIEHSFSGIDNITNLLNEKYLLHSIQKQNAFYVRK